MKVPCHLVEGDGPSRHLYATNTRDPKTHGALCLVNYVSFGPGGAQLTRPTATPPGPEVPFVRVRVPAQRAIVTSNSSDGHLRFTTRSRGPDGASNGGGRRPHALGPTATLAALSGPHLTSPGGANDVQIGKRKQTTRPRLGLAPCPEAPAGELGPAVAGQWAAHLAMRSRAWPGS